MSLKDHFTAEEWGRVVGAPMLAGIAVTAADPGGLWGALKESTAVASSVARSDVTEGLVAEVTEAYKTSEGRDMARAALKGDLKGKKPAEIVDVALAELSAITSLVTSKDAAAGAAYKAWLQDVARKVAEAGTEGGFMGFGGVKVSDAEKATLDRLAASLA
jgi:hypothetical protein